MTAKKKPAAKMTRGESAAMVIDRWAGMELELAETKKKLAYANELLAVADSLMKKGQESTRERVGALVEAAEALAAKNKELVELGKKLAAAEALDDEHLSAISELIETKRKDHAADQAEIEYWMGEVNRLHYELIDIRREAARDGVS